VGVTVVVVFLADEVAFTSEDFEDGDVAVKDVLANEVWESAFVGEFPEVVDGGEDA